MEPNKQTNFDENNKVEDSTRGRIDNASASDHQSKNNQIYNESANTQAESVNDSLYQGFDFPIRDSLLLWQNERNSSNSQILRVSETVQNLPAQVSNTAAYSLPVFTSDCVEPLDDLLRFPNTDRNNDQVSQASNSQYDTYNTGYCDANDAVNYNEPEGSKHEKVAMHYNKNYPVVSKTTVTTALDEPNQQPKNAAISATIRDLAESASNFDTYHQSLTPNEYQQSQASSSSQLIANDSNVNCSQSEQPTNVQPAPVNIFSNEPTPFPSPHGANIQQNSNPNNQWSSGTFESILTNIKMILDANKQRAALLLSNDNLGTFEGNLNDISHTPKIPKNIGNSLGNEADNNQMGQSGQVCATSAVLGNPQKSAQASACRSHSCSMENFAENSSHYSQSQSEQPTNVQPAPVNIFSNEPTPFPSPRGANIQQNSNPNNQWSSGTFESILTNIKMILDANKQRAALLLSNDNLGTFEGNLNDISHTPKIPKNIGNSLGNEADNNQMGQSGQVCATSAVLGNPQKSAQASACRSHSCSMKNFAENSSHYSQSQSEQPTNVPPALIGTHSCKSTPFSSPCHSVQQVSNPTIMTIDKISLAGSHMYDMPANSNSTEMRPTRAASWPEAQSSNVYYRAGMVNKLIQVDKCPYSDSNYSMDQLPSVNKKAKFSAGSSPLRFTLVPDVTDKVELASDQVSKTTSKTCLTPSSGNVVVKEEDRSILKEELVDLITKIYNDYKYNALKLYEGYINMPNLHSTVFRTSTYFHITMDINLFIKEITILIVIINKYMKTFSNQTSSFGEESTRILEIHRIMKSCNVEINSDSLTEENIEKINTLNNLMKANNIEGWPEILKSKSFE
ncbi:hypothetical protein TKK_0003576 [Trichogramma kaykai]